MSPKMPSRSKIFLTSQHHDLSSPQNGLTSQDTDLSGGHNYNWPFNVITLQVDALKMRIYIITSICDLDFSENYAVMFDLYVDKSNNF